MTDSAWILLLQADFFFVCERILHLPVFTNRSVIAFKTWCSCKNGMGTKMFMCGSQWLLKQGYSDSRRWLTFLHVARGIHDG